MPTILGLLAGGPSAPEPVEEARQPAGFHLELSTTSLSGGPRHRSSDPKRRGQASTREQAFVGRTFRATVATCLVGDADTVKLRARYLDHSQRGRKGLVLDTALVSNEIMIPGKTLQEPGQNELRACVADLSRPGLIFQIRQGR